MNYRRTFVTIAIAALSLLTLPQAEAQLLKKISKGLEKVNKEIEKVDKSLKGKSTKSQSSNSNSNEGSYSEEISEVSYDDTEDQSAEANLQVPYLTSETLFLEATPWTLSDVSDGVFSVRRSNNSSFDELYEFWKIDGKKLFDANWIKCTPALTEPGFHDGVVAMRKQGEGYKKGNVCLLYTDGRIKDMGTGIYAVTNFMDGAAIVWPDESSTKSYYIDTNGKRIYPGVTVDGGQGDCIRPLKDGLRAFPKAYNEWGYMDANGAVKLAAKYRSATDFSEGYAWVVLQDDTKHLIDKTGKSVFQAPESNSRTSDVVNGLFYVEKGSKTCYYDLSGKMVGVFEYGTCFHDGYAFVFSDQILSNTSCKVIDTEMNVIRSLPTEDIESAIVEHKLVFGKSNLYAFTDFLIKPDGQPVLAAYKNLTIGAIISHFGQVSADGYLVAKTIDVNNRLSGAAILKPSGEVVWVISEDPSYSAPISTSWLPYKGTALTGSGQFTIRTVDLHQTPLGPKK
ncbi:MAG: WG repeat-containing protein [Muribaculaceae bacterium]|nr:WG repeat-containing protein [Muribaculaceae bacterium]